MWMKKSLKPLLTGSSRQPTREHDLWLFDLMTLGEDFVLSGKKPKSADVVYI